MSDPLCTGCGAAESLQKARKTELFVCSDCVEECIKAIADAPTRIPGGSRPCGFCGKPEDRVAVMLALGGSLICDECVDHYNPALKK